MAKKISSSNHNIFSLEVWKTDPTKQQKQFYKSFAQSLQVSIKTKNIT